MKAYAAYSQGIVLGSVTKAIWFLLLMLVHRCSQDLFIGGRAHIKTRSVPPQDLSTLQLHSRVARCPQTHVVSRVTQRFDLQDSISDVLFLRREYLHSSIFPRAAQSQPESGRYSSNLSGSGSAVLPGERRNPAGSFPSCV